MTNQFTQDELKTILDVVNVYDPNDIMHVYPGMGTPEFIQAVGDVFRKTLELVNSSDTTETNTPELTEQEVTDHVREANWS